MRHATLIGLLTLTTLLTACTTTRVVVAPPVVYPDVLFECTDLPTGEVTTQEDVAKFVVDLGGAYWSCKTKLRNLKDLVNKPSEPVKIGEHNR